MSYDNNVYYNPEKSGLEVVDSIDFSDGCYQFDMLVVFRDKETGALFYAEDSGCSCPAPFENFDKETITPVSGREEILTRVNHRYNEMSDYREDEQPRVAQEIRDLKVKLADLPKVPA